MIKLIKQNKTNKKTIYMLYDSYNSLERTLQRISTVKYDKYNYYIEADDFERLVKIFGEIYNPKYYSVDDLCGLIYINKLKVGQKRKKKFTKEILTPKKVVDNAINRLKKKIPSITYDYENEVIYYYLYNWKIEFDVNEDYTITKKAITINGSANFSFKEVEEAMDNARELVVYFNRLSKRYKDKKIG